MIIYRWKRIYLWHCMWSLEVSGTEISFSVYIPWMLQSSRNLSSTCPSPQRCHGEERRGEEDMVTVVMPWAAGKAFLPVADQCTVSITLLQYLAKRVLDRHSHLRVLAHSIIRPHQSAVSYLWGCVYPLEMGRQHLTCLCQRTQTGVSKYQLLQFPESHS